MRTRLWVVVAVLNQARACSRNQEGSGFDVANTGYQVSPEQLQLAASQVERGAAKIKAAVDDVMRIIDGMSSDWSGSAQQQFSALCMSWARSANELEKSVVGISTLMKNAADAYQQAEAQVARLFGHDSVDGDDGSAADRSVPASPFSGLGPRPREDRQVAASTTDAQAS